MTKKANHATIEFLAIDLDLGFTFCETARIEADIDPPAMARLLEKIRAVIDIVARFSPRVEDEAERRTCWTNGVAIFVATKPSPLGHEQGAKVGFASYSVSRPR